MTDIKINGKSVISINKNKIELNDFINTMESDYKNIENMANYIGNTLIKSIEGIEMIENVWNSIIEYFKNVNEFIMNIFRSKIYMLTAKKLIDKINKIKIKDPEMHNKLDWFKKMSLSKDIQVSIKEIEELLDTVDDDQGYDIGKKIKKNPISTNVIKAVDELRKRSNGTYEVSIGEALYVLSKNDKGTPIIKSYDPAERLDLLIKYLNCYSNNSTSRLKALMRLHSKSNKGLNRAIKHKERKMSDEEEIDIYRMSVKINKICLDICIKNIRNVFLITSALIKTYMSDKEVAR